MNERAIRTIHRIMSNPAAWLGIVLLGLSMLAKGSLGLLDALLITIILFGVVQQLKFAPHLFTSLEVIGEADRAER